MDYTSLVHQAEQGEPPPVALVHGADTHLLDDVLAAVTRGLFREPSEAVFDREVVDGREVGVDSLVQAALTLPVLTPRRLVAVRHAQALKPSGAPAIAQYAAAPNPNT